MRKRVAPALLLVLAACAPADEPPAATTPADGADAPPAAAAPEPSTPGEPWAVSAAGAGPVRIGMTLQELAPLLAAPADTAAQAGSCDYVRASGAPDSMLFMVDGGRLVRVDVTGGATPTAEGARVGDPESRIRELYPDAREMPHKYTDGHYLVVLPDAPGDTLSRIVFETDGERVTRYRAGLFPPVEYVEGCG